MTYKEAKAYLQPIADNATLTGYREALSKAIEALEVADSVVRCKDCKHFDLGSFECQNDAVVTDNEGGASFTLNFYLDDFCSYGERRADHESI